MNFLFCCRLKLCRLLRADDRMEAIKESLSMHEGDMFLCALIPHKYDDLKHETKSITFKRKLNLEQILINYFSLRKTDIDF